MDRARDIDAKIRDAAPNEYTSRARRVGSVPGRDGEIGVPREEAQVGEERRIWWVHSEGRD